MSDLDSAIRMAYLKFNKGADEVVANGVFTMEFVKQVSEITGQQEDSDAIKKRLITLRKRGGDNGGLPRLRPK